MPSASVIIPAYRAEKFIVRAVTSLFAQSFADWEAIIVSDDKFDYQKFLAKHDITDKRLRFGSTGKIGGGPSIARNIAIDMAKADIIATLDADDTFDKRKLAMMVPMANKYGMALSNIRTIDTETGLILTDLHYIPSTRLIKYGELLAVNISMNSNIVYKKPKSSIHYPEDIKYCEDVFFVTHIYDYHGKAFYFRHKLHNYCVHSESLCRSPNSEEGFTRDRNALLSMLGKKAHSINDKSIQDMLTRFLQAGSDINKKYEGKRFSFERYVNEMRNNCNFLPGQRSWIYKEDKL